VQQTEADDGRRLLVTLQLLTSEDPPTAIFATNARITSV